MWLKWIRCEVEEDRRADFHRGQCAWSALAPTAGFVAQVGGWDRRKEGTAGILALWRDEQALADFMVEGGVHDRIYADSGQAGSFRASQVAAYAPLFAMPGARGTLQSALKEARLLRIAQCRLEEVDHEVFVEVQREIWLPAMRDTPGMLGGLFAEDGSDGYLVVTAWQHADFHQAYCEERLPGLRERVKERGGFPDQLDGFSLDLEEAWRVWSGPG